MFAHTADFLTPQAPKLKTVPVSRFFRPFWPILTLKTEPKARKPTSSLEKPRPFRRRRKGQRHTPEICDFYQNHKNHRIYLWLQYVINGQKVSRFLTSFILWPKGWSERTAFPSTNRILSAEGRKGLCLCSFCRFPKEICRNKITIKVPFYGFTPDDWRPWAPIFASEGHKMHF